MDIASDGKFLKTIDGIATGLSKVENAKKNVGSLSVCTGMVVNNGVLESIDTLTRIDTSGIVASFPFPQLFVRTNFILVCSDTEIYEYSGGAFQLKLTVSAASTWCLVDFHDFAYMSNGDVAVIRDAETKAFSVSDDYPTAMAMCNFNGQVIIGAPDAGYI